MGGHLGKRHAQSRSELCGAPGSKLSLEKLVTEVTILSPGMVPMHPDTE